MEAELGVFEAFYASPAQHPILLWAAGGGALLYINLARGLPDGVKRYCRLLVVLSCMDAWWSSNHIYGVGSLTGIAASAVPLFFVLAGDFRFLFLVFAGSAEGKIEFKAKLLSSAAALTIVVPIFSQLSLAALPASLASSRMMYLIYEVSFVCLTLSLLRWHPNLRSNPWLHSLCRYVIVYYALWASADIIILFGPSGVSDYGYLLRVIPNALYYGGLIAAIGWWAPRREAASRG